MIFSSPGQRPAELGRHLASVLRLLTLHILIFSCETTEPNRTILDRKHLWKIIFKASSFCPDFATNEAAMGYSWFWLPDFRKFFSSETAGTNGTKLDLIWFLSLSTNRGRVWMQQNEFNPTAYLMYLSQVRSRGHWIIFVLFY